MPLQFTIVIETNGVELHRLSYGTRSPGGTAAALATAYGELRERIADDGVADDKLTIRFEKERS